MSETGERIFRHVVALRVQGQSRRALREWCEQEFGPSEAALLRYSLSTTSTGLRMGVYVGAGSWSFSMTAANFENPQDAFAFKIRWG